MQILSYNPEENSYFIGASEEEVVRMTVPFTNRATACYAAPTLPDEVLCAIYGIPEAYELYFVLAGDLSSATFTLPHHPISREWNGFSPWHRVAKK